jgi:hypothetical protein
VTCVGPLGQTGVVSQLVEAYARGERLAGWSWLMDAFHLIRSAVVQCMPLNHESKARDLFFVFQSVSRANTQQDLG